MADPRRTALFETHQALGARCIDFGGWEMPVQFSGIVDEHHAVREACGLFDISHMGELMVSGTGATEFLNSALTNTVSNLAVGDAQYTLMCNDRGGVLDDLYVYRIAIEDYLLVVNASRIAQDLAELQRLVKEFESTRTVNVVDESDNLSAVAVQGPHVDRFVSQLFTMPGLIAAERPAALEKNQIDVFIFEGKDVYVSRTGYTGEDGFELIAPNEVITTLWGRLMELGQEHGIKPAGLGARDTLRMEMGYPLYGHELSEEVSPLEAGLGCFVDMGKSFRGRGELGCQKNEGTTRRNIAFTMTTKSPPPREGYPVWIGEEEVGTVTSGTQSPSLKIGIGMAHINQPYAKVGAEIEIEIRGRRFPAELRKKPLYQKS